MTFDALILEFDRALRTLGSVGQPSRPYPASPHLINSNSTELDSKTHHLNSEQTRYSAALMRVNHVGEVCAQALYAGQAISAKTPAVKHFNQLAAQEEQDHLLWTAQRLTELNAKPSLLNPLWYTGALSLGLLAGALGDKISLAFVKETEAQVEAHLHQHETLLPAQDLASRAIVAQMKIDEAAHGQHAAQLGGFDLPLSIRWLMRISAKIMTKTAYYV
jgi:ubiquinone biosynthesis monooxygenase Coq7